MSGECYSTKNLISNICMPGKENINQETKNKMDIVDSKVNQLHEYESAVTSAESKCSQLKGELERMKQLYNSQVKPASAKSQKLATRLITGKMGTYIEPVATRSSISKFKITKMTRQNSHKIGTDTTGAALGTINNILAGITKSIQISDLNKVKSHDSNKSKSERIFKEVKEPIFGVEDVKINSKSSKPIIRLKSAHKTRPKTSRSKVSTKTSLTLFRKTKLNENRPKTNETLFASKQTKKVPGKTKLTPRSMTRPSTAHQDLVEIYHNVAVKESKSSDSDVPKKRVAQKDNENEAGEVIPPLDFNAIEQKTEDLNKRLVSCTKNYTMPTISSRMKQVAKYYMNSFNIKTIPFCPATSTTASHNIGINIQQVMSMVKTKQPTGQLSPTLAYNIALAAGKWDKNPLSIMLSSATSKTIFSSCPLSRGGINYQHLQEMAKVVPQEVIEEVDENEDSNSPDTQSMIITGPSGDVKVTNRKQTVWTVDSEDKKCTCIPHKGTEIQQIINKFNGGVVKPKINKSSTLSLNLKRVRSSQEQVTPLQNKEKKLKEVLTKLHDEFEKMTLKYDDLSKKKEEGNASAELVEELEALDKELNSKEEEIIMVMTLYKEVLALKNQVKALKERSSKEIISVKPYQPKFNNGYSNLTTASLLNKLLNRIQHFQTHYKKN